MKCDCFIAHSTSRIFDITLETRRHYTRSSFVVRKEFSWAEQGKTFHISCRFFTFPIHVRQAERMNDDLMMRHSRKTQKHSAFASARVSSLRRRSAQLFLFDVGRHSAEKNKKNRWEMEIHGNFSFSKICLLSSRKEVHFACVSFTLELKLKEKETNYDFKCCRLLDSINN